MALRLIVTIDLQGLNQFSFVVYRKPSTPFDQTARNAAIGVRHAQYGVRRRPPNFE
ncbi:MAG: hypothetical protein AB7F79_11595 [Steroidobacteraceae bacterium]